MWKKSLLLLLCVILLTGCGTGKPDKKSDDPEAETDVSYTHLIVSYQTASSSITNDLDEVTEAINVITREKIGAEIEFLVVDSTDAFTEYPLLIEQGKQLDLMVLNDQDITTYVNMKMLKPLDDLLSSCGQTIWNLTGDGIYVTEGSVVNGSTYGVNSIPDTLGEGEGIWISRSVLDETGFSFDETHLYTDEELTELWGLLKAQYPNACPLGLITSGLTSTAYSYFYEGAESLGSDLLTGILKENGTIVDFYEQPEYLNFLKKMRKWYEAGYLYPDAAFTDASAEELIRAGILLTFVGSSMPDYETEELLGEDAVCLRTTQVHIGHQDARSGFWTIPITSANPEKAMEFLDLMYSDAQIGNLLQYGIEGKHYVILDRETGRISWPYGVSVRSTGYYNPCELYGDRRIQYSFDTPELLEKKKAYAAEAATCSAEFSSFGFLSESVSMEIAECKKVIEKYTPVLESGSVEPDRVYDEFISQLKMAGIDRIIEEKQRQYEEWSDS